MIERGLIRDVLAALAEAPAVCLLGPRQVGKTTLALAVAERLGAHYLDLESEADRARLADAGAYLALHLDKLVILDELHRAPNLFPVLRGLIDRARREKRGPGRYLLLGSAALDLLRQSGETLAGRLRFLELTPFHLGEPTGRPIDSLWLRGGFPDSLLAASDARSLRWRRDFIRSYLERDIPQFGPRVAAETLRRFWTMLAHYHGQTWNASELARSMGLSDKTVRAYLDILTGTFMIRQLQPWYENIGTRQVKSPKVYFRDSGILHSLLNLSDFHSLTGHPRIGASWEGFALEQTLQRLKLPQVFFWATHNGAELDLFFLHHGRRYGIEFKFSEAPETTKSMHIALQTLKLHHLWIIHPGKYPYTIDKTISALPLADVGTLEKFMR